MKNTFQILGIATIFLALLIPQTSYGQIKIGDTHEGGIVFYVDETGQNGLVCSKKILGKMNWVDAKAKCKTYEGEGYTDWSLPSKLELNLMYDNLNEKGIDGIEWGLLYWSSTERDDDYAWSFLDAYPRSNYFHVRAVRAF
ncbi:MAG: hypothetical protein ACI8P3_000017 [Saprospiraceae bacterium]|jgi:hypothetical protein